MRQPELFTSTMLATVDGPHSSMTSIAVVHSSGWAGVNISVKNAVPAGDEERL